MSDSTSGRGISSDDFDDDEIEWDDEESEDESDGLSPIEELVAQTEDFVAPKDDDEGDLAEDDDPTNS